MRRLLRFWMLSGSELSSLSVSVSSSSMKQLPMSGNSPSLLVCALSTCVASVRSLHCFHTCIRGMIV